MTTQTRTRPPAAAPLRPLPATVRAARRRDAAALARIYNHYVEHTTVTFEEAPVTAAEMGRRWSDVDQAGLPFLVAESAGRVVAYAYASPWKGRCAYRFSVEVSVYVDEAHRGRGLGSRLYARLFPRLRQQGFHVVIGGIALPNAGSVALHEKFGLRQVACFEEVGYKLGRWVDVGYWQRVFAPARR